MSRAFFISLLLHSLAVALVFSFLKHNSFHTDSNIKKISLNSIKIEKHQLRAKSEKRAKSHKLKAESLEPKAESKKRVESLKPKEKIEDTKPKEEQTLQTKKEPKVEAKREIEKEQTPKTQTLKTPTLKAVQKPKVVKKKTKSHKRKVKIVKPKVQSRKLKAKSSKFKVKRKKYKAQSSKFRVGRKKHRAKSSRKKAKGLKRRVHSKKASQITNYQSPITNSPNIKAQIYQAINEAKVYPRLAKKMNLQGSVYTCFNISPSGNVSNISTSGAHTLLQRGARQTINRAKYSFPNVPNPMHICLTITFTLE